MQVNARAETVEYILKGIRRVPPVLLNEDRRDDLFDEDFLEERRDRRRRRIIREPEPKQWIPVKRIDSQAREQESEEASAIFSHPESDVFEGEHPPPKTLLGSYRRMASPGQITLYARNLSRFYWDILRHYVYSDAWYRDYGYLADCGPGREEMVFHGPLMEMDQIVLCAELMADIVWHHETFHFACDLSRAISYKTTKYDLISEESLAVAYSFYRVIRLRGDKRTKISKIKDGLFDFFTTKRFDYKSPGYRDWKQYEHELRAGYTDLFSQDLKSYFSPLNVSWACTDILGSVSKIAESGMVWETVDGVTTF